VRYDVGHAWTKFLLSVLLCKSTHVQIIIIFCLFVVRVVNGWHRDIDYVTLKT
jgi:hypothetical protein